MADETPAPLSDAEITVWRASWEHYRHNPMAMFSGEVFGRLLATLAALGARLAALERDNAALREIVAAVANENVTLTEDSEWSFWNCGDCGHVTDDYAPSEPVPGAVEHAPGCIVTRARTLLADTQTPATDATAQAGEDGEA